MKAFEPWRNPATASLNVSTRGGFVRFDHYPRIYGHRPRAVVRYVAAARTVFEDGPADPVDAPACEAKSQNSKFCEFLSQVVAGSAASPSSWFSDEFHRAFTVRVGRHGRS